MKYNKREKLTAARSQMLVNFGNCLLHWPLWRVTNHPLKVLFGSKSKLLGKMINPLCRIWRCIPVARFLQTEEEVLILVGPSLLLHGLELGFYSRAQHRDSCSSSWLWHEDPVFIQHSCTQTCRTAGNSLILTGKVCSFLSDNPERYLISSSTSWSRKVLSQPQSGKHEEDIYS